MIDFIPYIPYLREKETLETLPVPVLNEQAVQDLPLPVTSGL